MQKSDRKTQNSKRRLPKHHRKTLKSYKKRGLWNTEKIYSPESKTLKSYKKRSRNIEKTYSPKYLHRKKVIIAGIVAFGNHFYTLHIRTNQISQLKNY